jgi:hypothetical protein
MCDIAGIIGAVASIAGAAMQAQAQAAFQSAQNQANKDAYEISKKAREDELARQAQYEQEAASYWDQTATALDKTGYEADQQAAQDEFMQTFDDQVSTQPEGQLLSGQQFANDTIKQEIAARSSVAAADARRRVEALSKLASYGTADATRGLAIGGNADLLTTLNGIRRGSLGVSQFEQNISPAQVYMGNTLFADVLSGAGGIISSKSGSGGSGVSATGSGTGTVGVGASGAGSIY